ncbi:hypothetical protein Emtol_2464 [Emticicia oligotrophica DSM 17448]|uniref:Uncharacterized protein n=1 Tax=Emticicia oligotrophica (strain DSM 17448 / CIP 109782 / MTCC 6937 / GPTSA100-15) TaxID=929562 RepID=A0ABM5N2N1_EMTOG|nr:MULTISPECIES: hypothetical protein [Emticicia]AFK03600.1 hypothetical protein Emtol_2464 [Emticicia oligotrophica DSM 17448]
MLLLTLLTSSYAVLCDMSAKDGICSSDTDIELVDDGGISDLPFDSGFEQINDNFIERITDFSFNNFAFINNDFSYLQNTYKIYLGLHTPPPKYI